jgi:hypothetical protein
MDADRFDTLARSLTTPGSRRRALASAVGGALGVLGLRQPDPSARRGKCKPTCDECQKCKKGDCEKKNGKKKCKTGKCKPKAAGTPCTAFAGGQCQNGTCINVQADEANCGSLGTACDPTQVCQAGSCFPSSTCPETIASACSLDENGTPCGSSGINCFCSRSTEGNLLCFANDPFCSAPTPCTTSADCPAGEACVDVSGCCVPATGTPLPAGTKTCVARCTAPTAAIAAADGGGHVGE